jgi:hypothetical protein
MTRARTAAKQAQIRIAIRSIEATQQLYKLENDYYAKRLSGNESLEPLLSMKEFSAAEAPPGPGRPYAGYCFKILTQQGPHAPGGAKSYLDKEGHLVDGYALLAYPASYSSGQKTYLNSHDGSLHSKDLGPGSALSASSINAFDPDDSWTREH